MTVNHPALSCAGSNPALGTDIDAFFAFARERHSIYLRRQAGLPKPWTQDPVLQTNRFTNVFRELDRTTMWFRKHVREPLRARPEVLLAAVVFRWFNRISTGEAIFCQDDLFDSGGPWLRFVDTGDIRVLRRAILALLPQGPYVTGAYTINTNLAPRGTPKLDGVLWLIREWLDCHSDWRDVAEAWLASSGTTLEQFCQWAQGPDLGPFMAYEVACDLRHTDLLCRVPDIDTWANAGPGARRGVNRVHGTHPSSPVRSDDALASMVWLLGESRDEQYWPQRVAQDAYGCNNYGLDDVTCSGPWPAWELREVEHTLCEFDKYCRVRDGQGQTRGRFDGK
jgi:alpha-glutamyl/putrescinyl thymine pyrophosphorylase clade 1